MYFLIGAFKTHLLFKENLFPDSPFSYFHVSCICILSTNSINAIDLNMTSSLVFLILTCRGYSNVSVEYGFYFTSEVKHICIFTYYIFSLHE